jgi:hypothetical protein
MTKALYTLYTLLALVVGFAIIDYCGGGDAGVTSREFLSALHATVVGAASALLVVCGIAMALVTGFIAISPLILLVTLLRACFKARR